MSIRDQYGRVLVGTPLSDWQYNVVGDGRDWAIVYEGSGGGSRAIETAVDPHDLITQVWIYRKENPEMPVRIMRRSGEMFPIPPQEKSQEQSGSLAGCAFTNPTSIIG